MVVELNRAGVIMEKRWKRRLAYVGVPIVLIASVLVGSNMLTRSTDEIQIIENRGAPVALDPLVSIAARYAPFIYHATDPSAGRQDIISNIDFDGDLIGNNNWENFDRYRLKPTVYYAVLETETHYFISYHLFHPRDWNHFTFWLNDTHENDGENLQVIVRKSDGSPVLLWTQAHYRSRVYSRPSSGIDSGNTRLNGIFQTVGSDGIPSENGSHAAVYVESQGHGIYGTLDSCGMTLNDDGSYSIGGSGLLFRPARSGETVYEPDRTESGQFPYQLDSVTSKLWPLQREGKLSGDGRLLDGSVVYDDSQVGRHQVPRYYDGDRFSGPLGNDRGISPFALDFGFRKGEVGALFFNPARRYRERLNITDPWSLDYIDYPFTR